MSNTQNCVRTVSIEN